MAFSTIPKHEGKMQVESVDQAFHEAADDDGGGAAAAAAAAADGAGAGAGAVSGRLMLLLVLPLVLVLLFVLLHPPSSLPGGDQESPEGEALDDAV